MSLIASLGFPERMAMTMAESIIRKACDRCHSQKLSCKRVGDEACERCVRLRTECKSSPSLRYKKQHQQPPPQQQQQQTSNQPYQRASHQTRSQASYQRKQEQQLQLHQQQHQQLQLHQQHQHQHQQHQQHQHQHQQHQHQHQHQHHQQRLPGQQQLQQQQQQQALGQLPSPAPQPQLPVGDTKLPISTRSPKRRRTDSEQSIPIIGDRGLPLLDEGSEVVRIEDQVGLGGEATLTPIDFDFGQFEELDFFATTSSQPPISHQGASVSGTIESFQPQPPVVPPAFTNPWTTQHVGHHHHQQQQLHHPPHHHHPHHPHHHQQTAEAAFPHAQVTTLPPAESGGLVPCGLSSSSPSSRIDVRGTTVVVVPDHQTSTGSQKRRRPRRPRNRPRQIALRHVANASSSTSPPSSSSSGNVHWMAQLSEINSRLVELAASLPQPQVSPAFNVQLTTPTTAGGHNAGGDDGGGFPIDEMFKLTRRVADVLDRWSAGYHHHGGGAVAMAVAAAAAATAPTIDSSDPGNSMFVLSTYVRLLDMYQKVFSLVRIELSQANCEAAFRFWRLPDVQVGSFSVDPSPSLQMSLTIQLAEEFLARLRAATAALDPALSNGGGVGGGHAVNNNNNNTTSAAAAMEESSSSSTSSAAAAAAAAGRSMFSEVVDVSYQAVKSKEESLGKHLAELRDEIEALLDV